MSHTMTSNTSSIKKSAQTVLAPIAEDLKAVNDILAREFAHSQSPTITGKPQKSDYAPKAVEPDGTIRLYFTLEQAQTKLHRSRQSATRIFRELEYSGLIIRKKQGLGKPALITLNYPSDAKLIAKEGEDAQA